MIFNVIFSRRCIYCMKNYAMLSESEVKLFASELRALRVRRGLTQKQLALIIGTTQVEISNWENARNIPSIGYIILLGAVFELNFSKILIQLSWERVKRGEIPVYKCLLGEPKKNRKGKATEELSLS